MSVFGILSFAWTVVGLEIAERVLDSGEHMGHKGSRKVNLLVVAVRFIEYTTIANALDITQCVVAVSAPGSGGFFGFLLVAGFPNRVSKLQPLSSRPSRGALVNALSKCRSRPAGQETTHPEPWHKPYPPELESGSCRHATQPGTSFPISTSLPGNWVP